jgi:hypothetical protein
VQTNSYSITVNLLGRINNKSIHVTNIYGPSQSAQKLPFITWLMNLDIDDYENWVLGGDFNLIRNPENRNKPGRDLGEMNLFNKMISDLDLVEIPFSGRNYT